MICGLLEIVRYRLKSHCHSRATVKSEIKSMSCAFNRPALNHDRRHIRASTVSGFNLFLYMPNTSFPELNALSLDALVAGIDKMSLAIEHKFGQRRHLLAQ